MLEREGYCSKSFTLPPLTFFLGGGGEDVKLHSWAQVFGLLSPHITKMVSVLQVTPEGQGSI